MIKDMTMILENSIMEKTGPKTEPMYEVTYVEQERPMFFFNLGNTSDPKSSLVGNTHFKDGEGTFFSDSMFVKAIQTENAIIMLDELSRAHPDAWNILMTVLDEGQRYLRLDDADGAPTIKVAKGVCFIATANIGSEYTSARVMDRAIMDRFAIIEMESLSQADEFDLLKMMFPNVNENTLNSIADISSSTRKDCKSEVPNLSTSISTRVAVQTAELIDDGFTLEEAAEVTMYPFFDGTGGVNSERTFVRQLVQKHLGDVNTDPFNTADTNTKDNPF